jgi:hypothetical protein
LDVYPSWMLISTRATTSVFLGFSLLALLVMNFERYLATYYPIFHRTSVTKGRLFRLCAHGRRFAAFSKTFLSVKSF